MLSSTHNSEKYNQITSERVIQQTIEYRPSYLLLEDLSIEIEAYTSSPDFTDPEATPIVVFLGYGEGSNAAKEATRILSEMTGRPIIVPVLNFDNSKDPVELLESASGMPLAVIKHINSALGTDIHSPVDVIGKSQGGAVAAELIVKLLELGEHPNLIRNYALISPAGHTNEYLGDKSSDRKKAAAIGLVIKNNMRVDQWSPRSLRAGLSIVGLVTRDVASGRINPKFELAYGSVNQERVKVIERRLHEKKPTLLLAGDRDPLFTLENYNKVLGKMASGVVEVMPGASHSAIMAAGDAQLESAGFWLMEMDESQRAEHNRV